MQNIFQPLKFVLFLCLFNATFIAAQDQRSGISYQALILNTSEVELPGANQKDSPLRNKEICLQFSLIDETGNYEYIEHVRTTTDSQGMVNLVIGTGTPVGGSQCTITHRTQAGSEMFFFQSGDKDPTPPE